jgi:hypothetical protein
MTIIDAKYLFATSGVGVIIALAIIPSRLKGTYSTFWTRAISAAIGGGIFYFAFLYLNFAFADKGSISEEFRITKTGNLGRSRKARRSKCFRPYAIIDFHGVSKELIFSCDYQKTIKNHSKVTVAYSKGFLGFDIIKSKRLTK